MKKKDFQILLTITFFLLSTFIIWKFIHKPRVQYLIYDFIASNKSYSKKIIIENLFMTAEEVSTLFKPNNPATKIESQKMNTSSKNPLYLVIRLKNTGNKRSWGVLTCQTFECGECEIPIVILADKQYKNYVIPTCFTNTNPPSSQPLIKWKRVYTGI